MFLISLIGYILYSGLADKITLYTWIAIGLVVLEGLVLLLFRLSCPLTVLARKYSDSERANFDMLMPEWLARHNKPIFTCLYRVGLEIV